MKRKVTRPRSGHIDYKKKVCECLDCGDVKSFDDFEMTKHDTPWSLCKACRSRTVMAGKREREPNNYYMCSNIECNYVWKRKGTFCTFCGTIAIEEQQ